MPEVSPGNLRQFAEYVREELDAKWGRRVEEAKDSKADGPGHEDVTSSDGDDNNALREYNPYPNNGDLPAPTTYTQNLDQWITTVEALENMLTGLADACDKIADNYESSAAMAEADVDHVTALLGEQMATDVADASATTV